MTCSIAEATDLQQSLHIMLVSPYFYLTVQSVVIVVQGAHLLNRDIIKINLINPQPRLKPDSKLVLVLYRILH